MKVNSTAQMGHSRMSNSTSSRWMSKSRCVSSATFARTAACPAFVVLQPLIAKPVEMMAPVIPTACEATAAVRPRSATCVATCVAVAAAPSTTAPAMRPSSTASETEMPPASSSPSLSDPWPAPGGNLAPNACRARAHSSSSSARAATFQSSRASCCRRSAWWARSAKESPAKVMPLVTAEPMPRPTPTGGATKSSTAEAMPSPALAVLPMFTPSHWPVKRESRCRRPASVQRCMSSSLRAAAHIRFVAQA
mmetsp:Transcript_61518/g.198060  ORF Transcript_61518/g.198060 Transcript_61518/m.198060 type:complete len:251 (-) Transcript_61518:544-1296(-)